MRVTAPSGTGWTANLTSLRQRLAHLAAPFDESPGGIRRPPKAPEPPPPGRAAPGLERPHWKSLSELFTRDVNPQGLIELGELIELIGRESSETFRFFSREVDFAALAAHPWWRRYALTAWNVFPTMAYRLSPPRRVAFALAMVFFTLMTLSREADR